MKKIFLVIVAVIALASCTSKCKTEVPPTNDTVLVDTVSVDYLNMDTIPAE